MGHVDLACTRQPVVTAAGPPTKRTCAAPWGPSPNFRHLPGVPGRVSLCWVPPGVLFSEISDARARVSMGPPTRSGVRELSGGAGGP